LSYASRSGPSRKPFNIPNHTTRSRQMSKEKTTLAPYRDTPVLETLLRVVYCLPVCGELQRGWTHDTRQTAAQGVFWQDSESRDGPNVTSARTAGPRTGTPCPGCFARNAAGLVRTGSCRGRRAAPPPRTTRDH